MTKAQVINVKRILDDACLAYRDSHDFSDYNYYLGLKDMLNHLGFKVKVGKDGKHFVS